MTTDRTTPAPLALAPRLVRVGDRIHSNDGSQVGTVVEVRHNPPGPGLVGLTVARLDLGVEIHARWGEATWTVEISKDEASARWIAAKKENHR